MLKYDCKIHLKTVHHVNDEVIKKKSFFKLMNFIASSFTIVSQEHQWSKPCLYLYIFYEINEWMNKIQKNNVVIEVL